MKGPAFCFREEVTMSSEERLLALATSFPVTEAASRSSTVISITSLATLSALMF